MLRNKAKVKVLDDFDRTPLHYSKSERATTLLLTQSSRNKCFETNRNAEEGNGYNKKALSAFKTMRCNILLQTAFRVAFCKLVNMPDKEGNTPLHSVIKSQQSNEESSDCIKTLLHNGADPYLCNESGFSVFECIDCSSDTPKYIEYSAKYKQSIEKAHKVFALVMLTLILLTIGQPTYLSIMISQESQSAVRCVGQLEESGNITLVPLKRSLYVILLIIVFFRPYL